MCLFAIFNTMNDQELKERYAQEDWGKLLISFGYEPYDTESSARRVAEKAAELLRDIYESAEVVGGQEDIRRKLKSIFANTKIG